MQRYLTAVLLIFVVTTCPGQVPAAVIPPPDTVTAGIYITSIHDIDFKQKEYTINCWLWLKYKNRAFNFAQNLEVPTAKTVTRSFDTTTYNDDGSVYMIMKLQCIMKDSWKIENFPFDSQRLRFFIENSQYDSSKLVFKADTVGDHFDRKYALNGWVVDTCRLQTTIKKYATAFGDDSQPEPRAAYGQFRVILDITRDAGSLFWKMFLGMYIAFLIAYTCFYIHADGIDSRFGLSVGALFAAIGNKYIIDSALPESTSFTLVDTLHGLTLFFIFCVVACTTYSLRLVKKGKQKNAARFDMIAAQVLLILYIGLNIFFISRAAAQ
ncbi:MAG: hypothetical protein ABIU63_12970 [Chitinophagaceae bacterium]